MAYHTALDVSLRSVSICIVDDDGAIRFEGKAAADVAESAVAVEGGESNVRVTVSGAIELVVPK